MNDIETVRKFIARVAHGFDCDELATETLAAFERIVAAQAQAVKQLDSVTFIPADGGVYAICIGRPKFCIFGKDHEDANNLANKAKDFASAIRARQNGGE